VTAKARADGDVAILAGRELLGDAWGDRVEAMATSLTFKRLADAVVCERCSALVLFEDDHRDWHRLLDAAVKLAGAAAIKALTIDIEPLAEDLAASFRRHIAEEARP
jgi:hypothetical protein